MIIMALMRIILCGRICDTVAEYAIQWQNTRDQVAKVEILSLTV